MQPTTTGTGSPQQPMGEPRPWHLELWSAQWTLASIFLLLGLLKALVPAETLQQGLHLTALASQRVLGPVGVTEVLGALGLVLPAATGVLPRLTPVAAACLGGVALMGAVSPETGGAAGTLLANMPLAVACAFVAWGRLAAAPITPIGLRDVAGDARAQEALLALLARPRSRRGAAARRGRLHVA